MDLRTDSTLIASVLDGHVDDYTVLVRRHSARCTRYATRMLGSADDADEALQSAFLRAYRALARCRDRERFDAWLMRIVLNECRTFAARRTRRERRLVRDELVLTRLVAAPAQDEAAALGEVQCALDRLDASLREAFLLKHVEDLSYEEMSALTGVGISALKMRVKRACARLRELLEGVRTTGGRTA
ncbi:MAG TPA: RNA polymerase sigma factor [Gemmatimonadaceae bacterium]|nr:RNA polymerase sigma factor [Gemmatimonadaceae bacterium]